MRQLQLDHQQITAFHKASYDANPLHLDAVYARRSQFGKPVVYGMAAVLTALRDWSGDQSFCLQRLHAVFRKPLYIGERYDIHVAQRTKGTRLALKRGPVEYLALSFDAVPWSSAQRPPADPLAGFEPRSEPVADPTLVGRDICYRMNIDAWGDLRTAFGIDEHLMPAGQLAALLWASYYVGMEMPGRQALFAEFKAEFTDEPQGSPVLLLNLDDANVDDRFNRYTVAGRGPGITSLQVAAFKRPLPADFPLSAMPPLDDAQKILSGQTVFVSGATRGFGAAFARVSALAGARLALNYRGDATAAIQLRDELRQAGAHAEIFAADMTNSDDVQAMSTAIVESLGPVHIVLDNAASPIPNLAFLEQSDAEISRFVAQNMAITMNTVRQLGPIMATDATLVHVSSKYLKQPTTGFSHYLAAKSAQAALLRGVALEQPGIHFVIAYLPRILTDQTNLAFDFDPPKHPGDVAKALVLGLRNRPGQGNYTEVDLFSP